MILGLISVIPVAVAKAAIKTGVARKKINDFEVYSEQLKNRLDPSVTVMQGINALIKKKQKKLFLQMVKDENNLKAAIAFKNSGLEFNISREKRFSKKLAEQKLVIMRILI